MPTKRFTGCAAVWRIGVCAGNIASSMGKAKVTPTPRRNVLRGMCFFVIIIGSSSRPLLTSGGLSHWILCSHLKRRTVDDTHHDRHKLVVLLLRVAHDGAHNGH